jgi:hypothetical protein
MGTGFVENKEPSSKSFDFELGLAVCGRFNGF